MSQPQVNAPKITIKKIGSSLRQIRLQQGYSLMQLAGKAGIDCSYLSRIENGKHGITIVKLVDLLEILDFKLSDFFQALEQSP